MINQRYKIKELLGKGRSSVYLCGDIESPGKDIAIKILPANVEIEEEELFTGEFFVLRKINHPNIVKAFNIGNVIRVDEDDKDIPAGGKYFTQEYFNGKNLLESGALADELVLKEIIKQLCSVLYYLHLSNYIYYDLKPENILVSYSGGKPFIKLIDLGFAQCIIGNRNTVIRGTAEYIAPEILKNQVHDHRVDFYSLGMVLYRLIYNCFPFSTNNEIDVYKAQIEQEFDFPISAISTKILNVVKKLLKKDPAERYSNAIQILSDLDIEVNEELSKDWIPAKIFAGRKDCLTILKTYIADQASREVFTVRGSEGAGKTTLAYALYSCTGNSILIDNDNSFSGIEFVKLFLKKIVFNNFVYPRLSNELLDQIDKFFTETPPNLVEEFNSIFNRLTNECSFVLIMDSFNSYDDFTIEILKNIIPILQVNHIKVILTENSDRHNASEFIANIREINLRPFTEAHLSEYLEKSFAGYFPKEQLKQLILSYADLLPGSLESFLKDLILLKIIRFNPGGIEIIADEKTSTILKSSHEEFYKIRVDNLKDNELQTARFISAFEISPDSNVIGKYLKLTGSETSRVLNILSHKNIIHNSTNGSNPVFTSEGLKKYVYSGIKEKKNYHDEIIKLLTQNFPEFNRHELARQYELAECYEKSYKVLKEELDNAEKISAYSFQKAILQHLLSFPLNEELMLNINIEFCKVLTKLNDYKTALNIINELINNIVSETAKRELLILKANCLIGLGELNEGKDLLESLINDISDPFRRNALLLDLANVNFNLNRYEETKEICNNLTGLVNVDNEILGSSYQLLGLISIYKDDDLDTALEYFEKTNSAYKAGGLKFRQAGVLMNIGNIYSMKGDTDKALDYWNQSLILNQSIGNIQQEAKLLINFGIYYFNSLEFEKSTDNYTKAFSIFNSLGIKDGQGLVETNLGEIFLMMCEYQKASESLFESIEIFRQVQNKEEELQAMFLLGKLHFIVGDYDKLNQLLREFEFKIDEEAGETNKTNFEYLLNLSRIPGGDLDKVLQSLTDIRANISIEERKYEYFYCTMAIINLMTKLGILDEAAGELRSENLVQLCSSNNIFEAERNYMLGVICEHNPLLGSKSSVDYYLEANNLLTDLHITELTWKVLYALFKTYNRRGNVNKSREYVKYSKSLITFIGENIKDKRLKNKYLEEPERKEALKELNYYEEQF
jgi:serine/threonine protein kinase